jgi:hypothetical protein
MAQVEKTKTNLLSCRCKFCPSYPFRCLLKAAPKMTKVFLMPDGPGKEAHVESLFCAYEPSNCIKEGNGCKCPGCLVFKKYQLDKMYYCLGGIAFESK